MRPQVTYPHLRGTQQAMSPLLLTQVRGVNTMPALDPKALREAGLDKFPDHWRERRPAVGCARLNVCTEVFD